ncbi:MAG: glycosyltransferase family 1 protein [Spirochaetales bacterium]|nr:glycosyltransferase family 1 protein [Spirochaetales bacterium]
MNRLFNKVDGLMNILLGGPVGGVGTDVRDRKLIRDHLEKNNKMVSTSSPRIFLAVKDVNWEKAGLVDSWKEWDSVHYDWGSEFDQYAPDWQSLGKAAFNKRLLSLVGEAHKEKPLSLFFAYLSGRWVSTATIEAINRMGIITVNLGFDDRHKYWGYKEGGLWTGNADIAKHFDINLTLQDPRDIRKYRLTGGRGIFSYPGGNEDSFIYRPGTEKKYPVSFIGKRYGLREEYVDFLKDAGLNPLAAGLDWPAGPVSSEEMNDIYAQSLLTLGFGFVGTSRTKTGLKGRDFEIPLTGTLYLTSYNKDLAECFREGEEIEFYRSREEMAEKVLYYKNHPEEAIAKGLRGRERSLADHLWSSRWKNLLELCGRDI